MDPMPAGVATSAEIVVETLNDGEPGHPLHERILPIPGHDTLGVLSNRHSPESYKHRFCIAPMRSR